jgi:VanZ family protein
VYLLVAVLYLAGLLPLLVANQGGRPHPRAYLLEFQTASPRRLVGDAILNAAAFVPVGWLLARAGRALGAPASTGVAVAAALCGLLSLGVETLQFFLPFRYSSLVDVLTNTSGAALGAAVAGGRRRRPP